MTDQAVVKSNVTDSYEPVSDNGSGKICISRRAFTTSTSSKQKLDAIATNSDLLA